jgi:large subunit ribosomal protein L44e
MLRPRKIKRYCAHCKTHREHEIERVKKRKASELKWGQRRFRKVTSGYRGFPRPKPEGREKPTRRVNLLYRCTECNRKWQTPGIRAKKFELKEH